MQPNVLLLDEPFANIDEENRQLILKQLVRFNSDYHTTIIITDHDLHGYERLHPLVWQLTKGHLTQLSSKNSSQLLTASATPQITTALPPSTLPTIIKFDELAIKRENHSLLLPTNLGIVKNKITLLTGPNGIGKSTLLKAIARLLKYKGKIDYEGENIQKISPGKYYKHLGLIFQHANDQFLNVTVGEELALGFKTCQNPHFNQQQVNEALTALGLNGREDQVVYSLSGGQKKKLQILLMLMRGQETLLLDEPFTGLDPFQHANDQFLNVTVGEELALGFKTCQNPHFNQQQVNEALTALGLNGREDQVVYSLSGGQKKKLQILLMLMRGQETLLLDEPFTGLDPTSLKTVLQLIKASQKEKPQTLLIVSHQLSGLDGFIDYHLTMNHQRLNYVGGRYES